MKRAKLKGARLGGVVSKDTNLRASHHFVAFDVVREMTKAAEVAGIEEAEGTKWIDANLEGANLEEAKAVCNLARTNLRGASLRHAELVWPFSLSGADLTGADLVGATGMSNEALHHDAASLEGATMPDGQKYEDWLKDKKAREEDGQNDDPS
jgi:uncharacterized protein YjbI with pentapeptide repeats